MSNILGIDIGGTKIILTLLKDQKPGPWVKLSTPKNKKDLIAVIYQAATKLLNNNKLSGAGVSVAGVLDKERTKLLFSPNLQFLNGYSLSTALKNKLGVEVVIENDAKCFALAEAILGSGAKAQSVLGITLGSGVGSGLVAKNQTNVSIYHGAWGHGFEAGHHIIKEGGPKCSCGNKGCWEVYAAKPFFQRQKLDPKETAQKADEGQAAALKVYQQYGHYVGLGIANLINILEPEIIVLGGGLSKAWPYFLQQALQTAKDNIVSPVAQTKLIIKISRLGESAGAIGAALLAQRTIKAK